ncbi:MAG: FecR family protein [Spirochaetales bacterium]|nr:FecR family protein [Spirochaetales bacterium]
MKRIILSFLACALSAGFLAAGDGVGEISYMVAKATITRAGKTFNADFGTVVENYDSITTTGKGMVEVTLFPESGINGTIRVQPGSSLYIEMASLQNSRQGSVQLLSGSVSATVKKLSPQSKFEVRVQGSVMGVRGTQFEVLLSVAGDILVTCSEGFVSCEEQEGGNSLFAAPGVVVERTAEGIFHDIPVRLSDIETYRQNWSTEKIEAFKGNANKAIADYARRYIDLKTQFDQVYRNLLSQKTILDKWYREDARNQIGSTVDIMKEKTALAGPLFNIKRVVFLFEPVYFRLLELAQLHAQGHGRGSLAPGLTSDQFFRRLSNESVELNERMANIRYILKLYAKRNEGGILMDGAF